MAGYPQWSLGQAAHKIVRKISTGTLALALVLALAGCSTGQSSKAEGGERGTIQVVTSIGQWSSLARQLGGSKVTAQPVINNPNADAHDYEPTTSDIGLIARADLVVINGADYDSWAAKAADGNDRQIVDVAASSGHHSGDNPHLWFSAQARSQAAQAITQAYQGLRPADKDYFAQQYKSWKLEEDQLSARLKEVSAQMQAAPYVATESAAYYLAKDLGLVDVTPVGFLQAVANESEPSPSDIHQCERLISSGGAQILIFNDQEASAVSEQLLAKAQASSVPIVKVSEQMPSQYHDLHDWISHLTDNFSKAAGLKTQD